MSSNFLISGSKVLCQARCIALHRSGTPCYAYQINKITLKCDLVLFEEFESNVDYDCFISIIDVYNGNNIDLKDLNILQHSFLLVCLRPSERFLN